MYNNSPNQLSLFELQQFIPTLDWSSINPEAALSLLIILYHIDVDHFLQTLAPVKMADVVQPDANSLQIPGERHLLCNLVKNDSLLSLYLQECDHADLSMSLSYLGMLLTSDSDYIPIILVHYKTLSHI